MEQHIDDLHIIAVNDGSSADLSDGVAYLDSHLSAFTYIDLSVNRGKGAALRAGMRASKAPLVLFTDIDFPYTMDSLLKVHKSLDDCDVAIGVRNASYYEQIPARRRMISKALKRVNQLLLRLPSTDTQGGLKGMRAAGRDVFLQTTIDRYLIDMDFLKLVGKQQLSLTEVEVDLREDVVLSEMSVKVLASELGNFVKILLS
jgi:glycosyltransferase involved in cell wall biosynthesis